MPHSVDIKKEALIIPRSEHPLSRKLISENALKVLRRLRRFDYIAYLAGGGVRDILLGREPKDFDIVTNATPEEIKKVFRNAFLIGKRFRIAHIRFKGEIIEVSTFRSLADEGGENKAEESENQEVPSGNSNNEIGDSRKKPFEGRLQSEEGLILRDNVWGTPEEDAARRDFTVNALFYDIKDFSIIDYTGGLEDLKAGRLKMIGHPALRYREDPVRMLRAVRFAAKLGFIIDDESFRPITEQKEDILKANASRLYEELQKLWISDEAEKGYQLMRSTGLFAVLFPEVENWLSIEEEGYPHTFLGRAFQWIEKEISRDKKISPALLFAIILSGPIEERAHRIQEEREAKKIVIFPAVKEVIELLRERISIPKRDTEAIKSILYGIQRFPQTKGKRPYLWRNNPSFDDAYRYFKLKSRIDGSNGELINWWEDFLASGREWVVKKEKKRYRSKRGRRGKGKTPV
ncbi:MAG: polynucleotide adenylyltransferase PcnB [Deltaproteobacteria bacterium]|nr:polynucleotide adenylyltransferase PcnB [Deltaproteobacteria bacterium]